MILWLSHLPTWSSLAILVAVANAVAYGAMAAVRGWHRHTGVTSGPAVVNAWATCAGALCALLFAFSIVTVWNQGARAGTHLDDEVMAMRSVARDLAPAQLPLLRAYLRASVAEWPRLCGGTPSRAPAAALVRLERLAKPRAAAYGDDLYRELATLEDLRARRWQAAEGSVPLEIWLALVVLSLALLTVLAVAMPDRPGTHATLMLAVGTALGTLFWVTAVLELPFCHWHGAGSGTLRAIVSLYRS